MTFAELMAIYRKLKKHSRQRAQLRRYLSEWAANPISTTQLADLVARYGHLAPRRLPPN